MKTHMDQEILSSIIFGEVDQIGSVHLPKHIGIYFCLQIQEMKKKKTTSVP
jgi:hypothetical protein